MLGLNYGPDDDPLAILAAARPRRDLGLRAGRRLSRRHQARLKALARWLIAQAGGDVKVFVDTAAVMEKPLAAARGPRLAGQAHQSGLARVRLVAVPRRDLHHARAAARRRRGRSLRHLPRLPRRLPDRGLSRALPARCAALHLLPDHRAQGPDPARVPRRDRQPHLRLRRLPRGLPVEQVRAGRPRGEARRARRRCARRSSPSWRGSTMRRSARCSPRSPVKRTGRDRFVRNVLIAIGNSGDADARGRGRAAARRRLAAGARRGGVGARPARSSAARGAGTARARSEADAAVQRRMGGRARGAPRRDADPVLLRARLFARALHRRIRRALRPHRRHGAHARAGGRASRDAGIGGHTRRGVRVRRHGQSRRRSTAARDGRSCAAGLGRRRTTRGDPVAALHSPRRIARAPQLTSIVYLSTVGVYGDHGGAWVDETTHDDSGASRAAARARRRAGLAGARAATRQLPVAILRLSGIYGPGQNAFTGCSRGRAQRIVKPGQVFNRIHVADIAQAIDAAFARAPTASSTSPTTSRRRRGDQIAFAAELLGIDPPPEMSFAEAREVAVADGAELLRWLRARCANDKLKAASSA